ncbi:MAG: RsmB/NOP family class I SAM-dependent RNA methyltransferase [Alphaproteobacteria bacterium]|nr:RsmB/NOP family class I SAM-dependent RNA methyltransferase [Alphaproteobacteria bacterium]
MQEDRLKDLAVQLIQEIHKASRPASEVINAFTRMHKFLGSKDRRFLTDIVWHFLRYQSRLNFCYPDKSVRELLNITQLNADVIKEAPLSVQWEVPEWLIPHIDKADRELPALLSIPNIVLRANGNRVDIQKKLLDEGIETSPTVLSPVGLILNKRVNLNTSDCYKNGLIEIQDEGSQLVALKTDVKPNQTVLDYCAGAGGKSLIFAQMMQNKGRILAHDISERSLKELQKRAVRSRVSIIETTTNLNEWHKKNPNMRWDFVIVDAPCSGTGTWRRCPDARWKLTQLQFKMLVQKQQTILNKAATFVPQNGKLVYMTCSLTRDENILQVQHFLKTHKLFKLCSHKQFSPYQSGTDGLFCAIMERT